MFSFVNSICRNPAAIKTSVREKHSILPGVFSNQISSHSESLEDELLLAVNIIKIKLLKVTYFFLIRVWQINSAANQRTWLVTFSLVLFMHSKEDCWQRFGRVPLYYIRGIPGHCL